MKTDIHPEYVECKVHCSCGNEFTTRSTVPSLRVELCSECHPFYTGKQKLVDTGGRVERFDGRLQLAVRTVEATDTDPALNPDFWFSFGSAHLWNMAQKAPATDWERRIDELMAKQIASPDEAERKRLFNEVQQIFSEHTPVVYFAAPRIFVGVSSRVTNVIPAVSRPQSLWEPDTLAVKP